MGCEKLAYSERNEITLGVVRKKNAPEKEQVDYYSFGSELVGKTYNSNAYRYGFNGKEKDDEIKGVSGSSYDFGARLYDTRLGRWLAVDKLHMKYPGESPFSFAGDSPILLLDNDGNVKISCVNIIKADGTVTSIKTVDADYVAKAPSSNHYDYGFQEKYDVFTTVTIDYSNMKDGKPTKTSSAVVKKHSWALEAKANFLNKSMVVTNELGDATVNTDDPFGQFTGNTNPVVSPKAEGGATGDGKSETEDWQGDESGQTVKTQTKTQSSFDVERKGDTLIITDTKENKVEKILERPNEKPVIIE